MSNKPKLLDLCCKAGGASTGYQWAGFEVTGVDIEPQPHYPFEFVQFDALLYLALHGHEYDVIAGSPPCQSFSEMTPHKYRRNHSNLIPEMRRLMVETGKPYIIENVEGARKHLINPLMLCGSMFGLPLQRHRLFENNFGLWVPPASCNHSVPPVLVTGTTTRFGGKFEFPVDDCKRAMQISWMSRKELDEAIPPAYTHYIGLQLMKHLNQEAA